MGELEFDQTFGGTRADAAYGIVQNGNEGFSLAGRTSSFGAGAEDIWFITVVFENETANGFTYGVMIAVIAVLTLVQIRLSNSYKKEKKM